MNTSASCDIPGESTATLLHITARLERRAIFHNHRYDIAILRLRRRACMALNSVRAPYLFAKAITKSKVVLGQLRRRLHYVYVRRRECVLFAKRLQITRNCIRRNRASLVRSVRRYREARKRFMRMVRRQRQLLGQKSKMACRFRLARLTPRIRRENIVLKRIRSSMITAQRRLLQSRRRLLALHRGVMMTRCRKFKRIGESIIKRYRRLIFRMRIAMRRVYRRWLIARNRLTEAMRLVTVSTRYVRWCYRHLQRTLRSLQRRRLLLCENGRRKFCTLPEIRPRYPTIIRLSLAGKCGVAIAKLRSKPAKKLETNKLVRVKPKKENKLKVKGKKLLPTATKNE